MKIRGFTGITTHLLWACNHDYNDRPGQQEWEDIPGSQMNLAPDEMKYAVLLMGHNLGRNLLLLQVSELLLQGGHLVQTLHPPPLTVLVIHLCSHKTHDRLHIASPSTAFLFKHHQLHFHPIKHVTYPPSLVKLSANFQKQPHIRMNLSVTEKYI